MFLFDYRSIEYCTTGKSPAYLMYKRELCTRFDLLRLSLSEIVDKNQRAQIVARTGKRNVEFKLGDKVLMDDHGVRLAKRIGGTIVRQTSPSTFVIKDENENLQKDTLIR